MLKTTLFALLGVLCCSIVTRGQALPNVDTSTLTGKVMCGYQGWFNCPGDGAELGWTHWARNRRQPFAAGNVTVDLDFLPVVYPGFGWHNLTGAKLNDIPRLKGEFLWSQFVAAKRTGCQRIYVAMFDEVDEGTAIFKCTNEPPVGDGVSFLSYMGVPSDYYLRLVGQGSKMLRGELPLSATMPSAK